MGLSIRLRARLLAVGVLFALGGCAAKTVVPVRMAQPGDEALGCSDIRRQIADNAVAAAIFIKQDARVQNTNTVKTIGSALPWVGLLAMASNDFSNEEQIKARALIDREERLTQLARHKNCEP
jgi:hypothetical protein